jgi:uncharacterized membrane protein SpoIIM required for sporulation
MLEVLFNPRHENKKPWKMVLIGILYGTLSMFLVKIFFSQDVVLSKYSGILVVTFCVLFSLPFMYYLIKDEEKEEEDLEIGGLVGVWKVHQDAIYAFLWLFLGFLLAFSATNAFLKDSSLLNAQVEVYCMINSPGNIEDCASKYSFENLNLAGAATKPMRFLSILENNVSVMIFTLVFSFFFGAGAIFILAWNATVIASAIGIFSGYKLSSIPLGLFRYMIHGFPEIAAYFITALAGGMLGIGIIRNGLAGKKLIKILENVIILLFLSIVILILAAVVEVYLTPFLFG